ncbi:MAG TPA: hypothetical protein VL492_04980 [Methylovirgula sp.]|nr:hypothetical protein [Methylovirgula sp.]
MQNESTPASLLGCHADAITQTFSQCERACLDVGMGLGEAIPGLSDLSGFFTTLAQSLESEEFRRAGGDLKAVAREIGAIGRDLQQESRALVELVDLNKVVGRLIEDLAGNLRVIAALVFNVKIEAALLNDHETNMIDFADDLKRLSSKAVRALEAYQTTHSKLYELLRRSCDGQIKFEEEYQTKLFEVSAGIAASLETVEIRRRDISKNLTEIGQQSQNIGMQIGQAVMALQVGDSTRQRIEHAQTGLHLAASIDTGDDILDGQVSAIDEPLRSSLVAQICRLQSLQINSALDQFLSEMITVERLLENLEHEADGLASRGRTLFGSQDEGSDSFVDELKQKLQLAHSMIEECQAARASVDNTARAVDTTIADLLQRTSGLSEIVMDITMIGLNTILKSSHLGQRGKCLTVIAQELQSYATEVVQGIKDLPATLQKVTAVVERFADIGKAHGADQMLALSNRMASAIESFDQSGTQMSDALTRLKTQTGTIGGTLNDATLRLGVGDDIQRTLKAAVESIDVVATTIADQDLWDETADQIFQKLRAAYTMASERQIHDGFVGAKVTTQSSGNVSSAEPYVADDEDLMAACLF